MEGEDGHKMSSFVKCLVRHGEAFLCEILNFMPLIMFR